MRPVRAAEISVVLILPNVKVSMVRQLHLPSEPSRLLPEKVKKSQYVSRIQMSEGYSAIWITNIFICEKVGGYLKKKLSRLAEIINTLRTGAFKLFKCTFPGSKPFKSTFILRFFKYL